MDILRKTLLIAFFATFLAACSAPDDGAMTEQNEEATEAAQETQEVTTEADNSMTEAPDQDADAEGDEKKE